MRRVRCSSSFIPRHPAACGRSPRSPEAIVSTTTASARRNTAPATCRTVTLCGSLSAASPSSDSTVSRSARTRSRSSAVLVMSSVNSGPPTSAARKATEYPRSEAVFRSLGTAHGRDSEPEARPAAAHGTAHGRDTELEATGFAPRPHRPYADPAPHTSPAAIHRSPPPADPPTHTPSRHTQARHTGPAATQTHRLTQRWPPLTERGPTGRRCGQSANVEASITKR